MRGVPGQAEAHCPAVAELEETMTNTELMNLQTALEAKRLELAAQLSGRIR